MEEIGSIQNENSRWVAQGNKITIAGRTIDGMVYIGPTPRSDGGWYRGNGFIDPSLQVSEIGTGVAADSLGYWPNYTDIGPQARAAYLDWLAGGRSNLKIDAGFVLLFFYGLERRFFLDKPSVDERRQIVAETERLLGLYGENHSIRRYFGKFLEAAQIILDPVNVTTLEPRFERSSNQVPLDIRVAIGQKVQQGEPLSADWVLSWCILHPETRVRIPMMRAFPECRALFNDLFYERYPNGLRIAEPKRLFQAGYMSASLEFEVDLVKFVGGIPDIPRSSRTLSLARKLVEAASNELDKYSRFLGRNPLGRETIEAHALLPQRIWHKFPCSEMEKLRDWANTVIEKGGLVAVEQVIKLMEGSIPEKANKNQLTGAADALARLSIGMAPDPRFALRSPKLGEPVVLFHLPQGITELEQVSNKYKTLLLFIALGSFVAHADGAIEEKERRILEARIDQAGLPEVENVRLHANLKWMLSVPLDMEFLRRRLQDVPDVVRRQIGHLALSMAAIDGMIDFREMKAIERLYKAIGLPTEDISFNLHEELPTSEPVTERPSTTKTPKVDIPAAPSRDGPVELDTDRIDSLMEDTALVSSVLGEIFGDKDEDEEIEEPFENSNDSFQGLDVKLAGFLEELLTQQHWDESDWINLANQFELMPGGALESLNEWSLERYSDSLIEKYEGYDINQEVVKQFENIGRTRVRRKGSESDPQDTEEVRTFTSQADEAGSSVPSPQSNLVREIDASDPSGKTVSMQPPQDAVEPQQPHVESGYPSGPDKEMPQPQLIGKNGLRPYSEFDGPPFPDPRRAHPSRVAGGLYQIIQVEGPMLAKRAYDIYLRSCGIRRMGHKLKSQMDKALQHAISQNLVVIADEGKVGGFVRLIVRLPVCQPVVARERGPREFGQIPPSELQFVAGLVRIGREYELERGSEEHLRAVLKAFDLRRFTKGIRTTLLDVLERRYPYVEAALEELSPQ